MTAVHVTVWDEAGADAPAVVLVHGTMTWGTACFEAQRPLAGHYRLLVMDRRGFGESPDIDRSDYEVDAADVVELLGDGAHLVGHSYGGVVAMLAASLRPRAVRSLALIEPSAFRLAAHDPTVAAALERPSWEADVSVEPLARASWPKLVVSGTWENPSPDYRAFAGEPLMACAQITADRIGASLLLVPGASHEPHRERPEIVNAALGDLWERWIISLLG